VLADSVSMQTVANGPGEAWKAFYRDGVARTPVGKSPHYMIGLAVGSAGFQLSNEFDVLSVAEPPWEEEVDGEFALRPAPSAAIVYNPMELSSGVVQ
jgi:hypothetical protein